MCSHCSMELFRPVQCHFWSWAELEGMCLLSTHRTCNVSVIPFEENYKRLMAGSVRLKDIVLPSPVNHTIISRPMAALMDCQTPAQLRAVEEFIKSFSPAQQPLYPSKSNRSLGVCAGGRARRGLGEEQKDSKSSLLLPSLKMLAQIWMDKVQTWSGWGRGERQKCTVAGDHGVVGKRWLWAGKASVHRQSFCIFLIVSALDATTPVS